MRPEPGQAKGEGEGKAEGEKGTRRLGQAHLPTHAPGPHAVTRRSELPADVVKSILIAAGLEIEESFGLTVDV
jgi:hypothetical protein